MKEMEKIMSNNIKNLNYCVLRGKCDPKKDLQDLGITYKIMRGKSMSESIWFLCCENVPKELPPYINYFLEDNDYYSIVGYGIGEEVAKELTKYVKEKNTIMRK